MGEIYLETVCTLHIHVHYYNTQILSKKHALHLCTL